MPLLDHFHPPLSEQRFWYSFHNSWATYISSQLNAQLPAGYFAAQNVQFGIEIDVATFEVSPPEPTAGWTPPPPQQSGPMAVAGPVVEVGIISRSGGPSLVAAVELVSPANKDRDASREAFVSKCAGYLQAGIGLIVVDVVTERHADLHGDLLARLGLPTSAGGPLYATAYRPVVRDQSPVLDVWREELAVGGLLPTLPLWLRGGPCMPVELQASYDRTCQEQRVTPAA